MPGLMANWSIPGGLRGGELQGAGFGKSNPIVLSSQSSLQVTIAWQGNPADAPPSLTGYFVFSPAEDGTQDAPSPFLNNGNYLCSGTQTAGQSSGPGSNVQYLFSGYEYAGGLVGHYELTFVAEWLPSGATVPTQWSADPEFETGN